MKCIADKSGSYLSEDEFAVYVEMEDPPDKPSVKLSGNAKEALKDYYEAAHTLCEAQKNFMESTKVLESKLESKEVFLDLIKQVQQPAVQVTVRMIEEEEALEGKIYWELTLLRHLPNYKKIYPNATEQTRTMAAFMYYVL